MFLCLFIIVHFCMYSFCFMYLLFILFQDCIFILEVKILKACFFPENVLVHLIIPTLLLIVSPYLLDICNMYM